MSNAQLDDDDEVLTQDEAAPIIHPKLSPHTMERWRIEGKGPAFIKVGRRVGYRRGALREFKLAAERTHTRQRPKASGR